MPFTTTDAENLRRAIADGRGARSMTFDNQTVVFNSLKEMLELLAVMDQQAATANGSRVRYRIGTTRKGA